MNSWANDFGKDMEKKFSKSFKPSLLGPIIGLFIILWGLIWLGNDLGWWTIPFPLWLIILILLGGYFLLSGFKAFIFYK
jgi:hypothetical protein